MRSMSNRHAQNACHTTIFHNFIISQRLCVCVSVWWAMMVMVPGGEKENAYACIVAVHSAFVVSHSVILWDFDFEPMFTLHFGPHVQCAAIWLCRISCQIEHDNIFLAAALSTGGWHCWWAAMVATTQPDPKHLRLWMVYHQLHNTYKCVFPPWHTHKGGWPQPITPTQSAHTTHKRPCRQSRICMRRSPIPTHTHLLHIRRAYELDQSIRHYLFAKKNVFLSHPAEQWRGPFISIS